MTGKMATLVGANGGFGQLFAGRLRHEGWKVAGVDLSPAANDKESWSGFSVVAENESTTDADGFLKASSLIILCVPSEAAFWWIDHAAPLLSAESLCLDVLSVKTQVQAKAAAAGFAGEYLSLHPMFAPRWGFANYAVAAITVQDGPRSVEFLDMIQSWGSRVVKLSAEEHDKAAAVLQGGAHAAVLAFARATSLSGVPKETLEAMGTAVSGPIFDLVQRITAGDPATYHSIQSENPYAQMTRDNLMAALKELDSLSGGNDGADFGEMMARLRNKNAGQSEK